MTQDCGGWAGHWYDLGANAFQPINPGRDCRMPCSEQGSQERSRPGLFKEHPMFWLLVKSVKEWLKGT